LIETEKKIPKIPPKKQIWSRIPHVRVLTETEKKKWHKTKKHLMFLHFGKNGRGHFSRELKIKKLA
jgi:hypothetical protein